MNAPPHSGKQVPYFLSSASSHHKRGSCFVSGFEEVGDGDLEVGESEGDDRLRFVVDVEGGGAVGVEAHLFERAGGGAEQPAFSDADSGVVGEFFGEGAFGIAVGENFDDEFGGGGEKSEGFQVAVLRETGFRDVEYVGLADLQARKAANENVTGGGEDIAAAGLRFVSAQSLGHVNLNALVARSGAGHEDTRSLEDVVAGVDFGFGAVLRVGESVSLRSGGSGRHCLPRFPSTP